MPARSWNVAGTPGRPPLTLSGIGMAELLNRERLASRAWRWREEGVLGWLRKIAAADGVSGETDERSLGPAARIALVLLGALAVGAGLFTGFHAVAVVVGALAEDPVQPLPIYALGLAILVFPALLLALGFASLGCRERRRLRPPAALAGAAVADLLLASWLLRLPTGGCTPHWARGTVAAGRCIDRSWSGP